MDFSYTFIFWLYVGIMSCTSVFAYANSKAYTIPRSVMVLYNLINSCANLYIVAGIAPYVCNTTLGIDVPDDTNLRAMVYLHYMTKYLDFFDTFIMILRHKWKQVHLLQLFHHSTIGVVWYWVYMDMPTIYGAGYAFGAFVNSFIHFLMYLHYFVTTIGMTNPFKNYMTAMQMFQFALCLGHALYNYICDPKLAIFSLVQVVYMLAMLTLFYSYVYRQHKHKQSSRNIQKRPLAIKIKGQIYDAVDFAKRHPGGNIIEKYDISIVEDATDAFENFHTGSLVAHKLMLSLPKISTSDTIDSPMNNPMPTDFQQMVRSWHIKGLYSGGQIQFILWAIGVAIIVFTGFYLLGLGYRVIGGLVVGFGWGQCGFIQHHAGHLAFTNNASVDFTTQAIYESLMKGGSGRWWRNRHNKHHAMPNSIQHDGDLRTTPFFAWDDVLIKKVPTSLLRIQHLLFIPMLGMYVPILATSVLSYVVRMGYWDELGLIALHFVLASRFNSNIYDLLIFYFIGYAVQGIYLGCMFGMSHYTYPRVETDDQLDWVSWQCTTACNWGIGSRFAEYFSGFLNLQIEHHIATRMPPENYHLIIDDMRKYTAEHSLPYFETSFADAFKSMIVGLHRTGRKEYDRRLKLKSQ